ncbi:hypothetical protein M885DRAFT_532277 [Pelagophyceae sp. CCMP2097]|nr:hypothetical protein M885DRAFT_532277 [Pelagophyceae sp. CCMP2097]
MGSKVMQVQGLKTVEVQSLPCTLAHDGAAQVRAHRVAGNADEAAFRGRALKGVDAQLGEGYVGLVLEVQNGGAQAHAKARFDSIRVWHHDASPPADHYILETLQTLQTLDALHGPDDAGEAPASAPAA